MEPQIPGDHSQRANWLTAVNLDSVPCEVQLKDYREVEGVFGKINCFGMMEHLGKRFVPTFFRKFSELLTPGGLGLIHFSGNDMPYSDDPWISTYIFPGYHVTALSHVIEEIGKHHLSVLDVENLRHFGLTIEHWFARYEQNIDKIRARFGESFARAWRLYLAVTVTSYHFGGNRDFQVLFSRGLNNELPWTRDHLYR